MRLAIPIVLSCFVSLGSCRSAADPASKTPCLSLAKDGKPNVPVVFSSHASADTQAVARQVAGFLSRIVGAEFDARVGDGSEGIVVGTLREFPHPELAEALEIRNIYDGKEAYAIRTEAKRVLLLGATDIGASHAAYRFLESLGCRWFFPAREWEVIPSNPSPVASLQETSRPALWSRRIWWEYGFFESERCASDYQAWARRNRMAMSMSISAAHAWQSIVQANQNTFAAHPEYLALVNGKRQGPQLCVGNPEVRKIAVTWALDQLARNPGADMVSMEAADGQGHCECTECRRMGSISDRFFGLANEAARAVAREYPGKMVGVLAYNDHCDPPSFAIEPNVHVQLTAGLLRGPHTFEELLDLWSARCRTLGVYEYFSVWLWDRDLPVVSARAANLKYLRRQIPKYAAKGVVSLDCESGNNWGVHGLGYYVTNRLAWNPKVDVDELLADFYDNAFGPASAVMRRYYERLDPGNRLLLSDRLVALALRDLQEASRLCHNRPDILARLAHLKQYQHYVRMRREYDRATDKDRKRDLALAVLTHMYRTRSSYMNHWEAARQSWTPQVAKEMDRPSWSAFDPSLDKPWKVEAALSNEETERQFQEDIQALPLESFMEREYSSDLVLGEFPTQKPVAMTWNLQDSARYALFSRKGEALAITLTTGTLSWYRDHPDTDWKVFDALGLEIAGGRFPLDGKEHPVSVSVPRAGLYWLEVEDHSGGWKLDVEAGRPVSLLLQESVPLRQLGDPCKIFFYVPKGIRRIEYFWDGRPHQVVAPDERVVSQVTSRGKLVRIPVEAGQDGRVWALDHFVFGHLWFYNVPNVVAASPDALLVPRKVARER